MNAPVRVSAIADWLHQAGAIHKALGMFEAYFDESDTHGEAFVTTIAGYVATKDTWIALEQRWSALLGDLAEFGVRTFHMHDAILGEEEFSRVDKFHRDALIKRLSEVLAESDVTAIWSWVIVDDWNAVVRDPLFLAQFPKPFDLCFEYVVRRLRDWALRNTGGEKVAPMFAYQPEYHVRMDELGRVWGKQGWYRDILGPLAFDFPSNVVPLQAADFVAHQIREDTRHFEYDERKLGTMGPTLALSNATKQHGLLNGGGFDAPALAHTVERFLKTGAIL